MAAVNNTTLFSVPEGNCPTYDADNPSYSPFANLERAKIYNACKRDAQIQDEYFTQANKAYAIIYGVYARIISREMAITMLKMYCHRSRETAILNIDNSDYSRMDIKVLYTEKFLSLRNALHKMLNGYAD